VGVRVYACVRVEFVELFARETGKGRASVRTGDSVHARASARLRKNERERDVCSASESRVQCHLTRHQVIVRSIFLFKHASPQARARAQSRSLSLTHTHTPQPPFGYGHGKCEYDAISTSMGFRKDDSGEGGRKSGAGGAGSDGLDECARPAAAARSTAKTSSATAAATGTACCTAKASPTAGVFGV